MCKNNNTCLISAALSIVLAIAVALAFFAGLLPGIVAFVIATLILAALATFVIVLVKGYRQDYCLCENGTCLAIGIAGTFLFGLIALAVTLTVGAVLPTVLIGILGFFAGLTLINLIALLICVSTAGCSHKEC